MPQIHISNLEKYTNLYSKYVQPYICDESPQQYMVNTRYYNGYEQMSISSGGNFSDLEGSAGQGVEGRAVRSGCEISSH